MKRAGILFLVLVFATGLFVSAENVNGYKNELNIAINVIKMHHLYPFAGHDTTKSQVVESQEVVIPTPVEEPEAREISLYPNPCIYSMKVSGLTPGDELVVYNSIGQVVLTMVAENETETIDVSDFPPGIYHLAIIDSKLIDKVDFIK